MFILFNNKSKKTKIVLSIIGAILLLLGSLAIWLSHEMKILTAVDIDAEIKINKPVNEVFAFVSKLNNQQKYANWFEIDTSFTDSNKVQDGEIGFMQKWNLKDSKDVKGEQEIVDIRNNQRVDFEIRFIEPTNSITSTYILTKEIDSFHTMVNWHYSSNIPEIMKEKMLPVLRNQLQAGINNMKKIIERK